MTGTIDDLSAVRTLAVLGLGRSGRAATLLALRRLSGAAVTVIDAKDEADLGVAPAELRSAGAAVLLGATAVLPPQTELLVKSPGVPNESPVVRQALAAGVPVWSEVELAARFLANRWIGITGTNGKTTTTELTGQILRDAGRPVEVAGNVGRALANLPGEISDEAVIVAELSSFQLEHIERFRPEVGVLLNLTEDHIDRHGDYGGYVDAKLRLFENQRPADLALVNADDPGIASALAQAPLPGAGRRGRFSLGDQSPALLAGVSEGILWLASAPPSVSGARAERERLCAVAELALKGEHNLANSLAAAVAAAAVGVPAAAIARTLRTFAGVAHRLQVVATVAGVTYVNDSKATNVDAARKALTAYSGPVHLILGGSLKGASFDPLAEATEGRVAEAILIGAAASSLREAFERRRAVVGKRATPYVVLPDLEAAVRHAADVARPGDVVLLSPACASFDHYRNFEHRGEHFCELVHHLEEHGET